MANQTQTLGRGTTTGAESFWYVLGCISFAAAYFAKIPSKKALSEYGLCEMTGAEKFWYVVQNICFGSGYLAKVPVKKALSEVRFGVEQPPQTQQSWPPATGPQTG
ncbi:hypothetical protein [Streptomyces endophyticus]|uniref:Uncharacterized protein n=1 Tax=Streptomyces endophyticus TaxID=714166 RepID=A0ABU6FM30_9ACTN|nr:hypothetical protein [Streptomyces endophyticus]MEB8343857.1 hypothetical protein [Streptomyces endophyticus]